MSSVQRKPDELPTIAVFSGPTATIQNSPPLVTSDLARRRQGLAPRVRPGWRPGRFDALRPQRLAAPVTVYSPIAKLLFDDSLAIIDLANQISDISATPGGPR